MFDDSFFTDTTTHHERRKADPFKFDKLADQFIADLKSDDTQPFCYKGRFYIWDGTRYIEERELCGRVRKWLEERKQPQSNNVVGNVVPIIESRCQRFASEYGDMPFYAGDDAFPPAQNVIAFANGLLDIEQYLEGDRQLIRHTANWASTFCLPFEFDANANCPRWNRFLAEVYPGRPDKVAVLQEWFGYCLTADMSQQKMLFLVGVPNSGKGVIGRLLIELIGRENVCEGYDLNRLASNFGCGALHNKQLAYVGELSLNKNTKLQTLEVLKKITGQDAVQVERKFCEAEDVYLTTRFIIALNEMPALADTSGAIARRILLLTHEHSFENCRDTGLGAKLSAELSGIANWALGGLARLRANGKFTESPELEEQRHDLRRENSGLLAFIEDCLVVERRLNPGNLPRVEFVDQPLSVGSVQLQGVYERWCIDNAREFSWGWFGQRLRTVLPNVKHLAKKKTYVGIGLRAT